MSTKLCPTELAYLPPHMKRGNAVLCPSCQRAVKITLRPYTGEERFHIEPHEPKTKPEYVMRRVDVDA